MGADAQGVENNFVYCNARAAKIFVSINSKGKKGINPNKAASIVVWLAFDFFSLNYKKFDFLVCFLKRSYFV